MRRVSTGLVPVLACAALLTASAAAAISTPTITMD